MMMKIKERKKSPSKLKIDRRVVEVGQTSVCLQRSNAAAAGLMLVNE